MPKTIHLGVTGLRRTGKTVFLTSLIYQLTELGSKNLDLFDSKGVVLEAAEILDHPGGPVKPFPYSENKLRLTQSPPVFPDPTVRESTCVLEFNFRKTAPPGRLERLKGAVGMGRSRGTIQLYLHDYPGEFLLDAMLGRKKSTYDQWSVGTLERMWMQCPQAAHDYQQVAESSGTLPPAEILDRLRNAYGRYALASREAGVELIQPAMSLLPWFERCEQCRESSALIPSAEELPFVPLPGCLSEQEALAGQMRTEFVKYVRNRVKPFLSRIQHCQQQLVLVDVLRILRNGYIAFNDTRACLAQILKAIHDVWRFFGGIQQVRFAATKADHATRNYRPNLTKLLDELVFRARGKLKTNIDIPSTEWFTSLRCTEDAQAQYEGVGLSKVGGKFGRIGACLLSLRNLTRNPLMDHLDLTPEQEAQAQQIEDQLLAEARVRCRQIARLLASKDNSQLLGETEFQVRDHVHQIGARALDAALETRKKNPTPDAV